MMRVNTKPRHKNSPRPAEKNCPQFLQWLRGRECVFARSGYCEGKIEAAHVDYAGDKGIATKVADRHAIPMCQRHHGEQHTIGWKTFEWRYGEFNARAVSEQYWRAWPGRIAWERKLRGEA